jgi:hypothetical protein
MNGLDITDLGRADNAVDLEIAFATGTFPNANSLIRELDVEAIGVCLGIYGDASNAQLFAGTYDTNGDFASVGDENLVEHDELASKGN